MSRRDSGILKFLRWPVILTALIVASPFIWWAWLSGKQGAIHERATSLYSSLQSGTVNRKLVTEEAAEQLLRAEGEFGQVDRFTEVSAFIQALGKGGGARIETVRKGRRYTERLWTNDETTPFGYHAIHPTD